MGFWYYPKDRKWVVIFLFFHLHNSDYFLICAKLDLWSGGELKGSNDTMTSSYLYIALKSDRESDKTTRSPPNFWYYKILPFLKDFFVILFSFSEQKMILKYPSETKKAPFRKQTCFLSVCSKGSRGLCRLLLKCVRCLACSGNIIIKCCERCVYVRIQP